MLARGCNALPTGFKPSARVVNGDMQTILTSRCKRVTNRQRVANARQHGIDFWHTAHLEIGQLPAPPLFSSVTFRAMKYIYALAFSATLFSGCSKEKEEEVQLPLAGKYDIDTTLKATELVTMYTVNGPVNNPQLVDRFVVRFGAGGTAFFSRADQALPSRALSLTITPSNRASFATSADTLETDIITQNAQHLVVEALDSVLAPAPIVNVWERCALLTGSIKAYYPAQRYVNIFGTGGYERYGFYRPIRVIINRNGQLFAPYFSWLVRSVQPSTYNCYRAAGGEWNAFNPAILNQLIAGDTIVVQSREAAFLRR